MTNRQWLIWKLIDMSDDELMDLLGNAPWFCAKFCAKTSKGNDCDSWCWKFETAWLQQEYVESEDSND